MNTAIVTSSGDLRLPADMAEQLNAKPGDAVVVETDADGTVRIYPKPLRAEEVFGCLAGHTSVKSTIEEMDESVAEAFRKGEL